MYTKSLLVADDLAKMFEAVLEYNRKGKFAGARFCAADGTQLPVAYAEVWADEPGLAVRSAPEADQAASLDRMLNPPVDDPRKVPGPASVGELDALAKSVP